MGGFYLSTIPEGGYMRIHDTEKLVARARSHARADHVMQGTYGRVRSNGKAQFEGCAVGCLSTPSYEEGLGEMMDNTVTAWFATEVGQRHLQRYHAGHCSDVQIEFHALGYMQAQGISTEGLLYIDPEQQREDLAEEFGLTHSLVTLGEGLFESQPTHGQAIEFVRSFAEAMPEGGWVDNGMVAEWINASRLYCDEDGTVMRFHPGQSTYEPMQWAVSESFEEFGVNGSRAGEVEIVTAEALEWIGSNRPAKVTA